MDHGAFSSNNYIFRFNYAINRIGGKVDKNNIKK